MTIRRQLNAKIRGQKLYDPKYFLSPRRIDIAAKTIFARAYLEGNISLWPEVVYKEHIRAFNNFYEEDPLKRGYKDFKDGFIRTIEGIKNGDSWKHKAPVVGDNNFLINGSHRVAASLVLNDKVNALSTKNTQDHNWDYRFFLSNRENIRGIREDILDYITIEYVSLKSRDIFAVIIFPTAEGHREQAYKHLLTLGEIVNMKSFKYNEFVGKEVIKQLYFNSKNDEWNHGNNFVGAKNKADNCFTGKGDLQVYIIESKMSEPKRVKEKQYLRDLWKKDKHSIHITDTIEEVNRVVRMFFNDNSRNFMKIKREKEFSSDRMYSLFYTYTALSPKDVIEREKCAVEGSAVFDLYNIREGRDLDYISRAMIPNLEAKDIDRHTDNENKYHTVSVDELLTNPKYYFYYKGYKIITLKEMEKFKINRSVKGDDKDVEDAALIRRFLMENKQDN